MIVPWLEGLGFPRLTFSCIAMEKKLRRDGKISPSRRRYNQKNCTEGLSPCEHDRLINSNSSSGLISPVLNRRIDEDLVQLEGNLIDIVLLLIYIC